MKKRRIIPFGLSSIILLILMIVSIILIFVRKDMTKTNLILLIIIAAISFITLIRNTFSFIIYYDEEKIWMKNDWTIFKNNRIQNETEIYFKDMTGAGLVETSSNSVNYQPRRRAARKMKFYLEIDCQNKRSYRLYVSLLGKMQLKTLFVLIYQLTNPHVLIAKDIIHE